MTDSDKSLKSLAHKSLAISGSESCPVFTFEFNIELKAENVSKYIMYLCLFFKQIYKYVNLEIKLFLI